MHRRREDENELAIAIAPVDVGVGAASLTVPPSFPQRHPYRCVSVDDALSSHWQSHSFYWNELKEERHLIPPCKMCIHATTISTPR